MHVIGQFKKSRDHVDSTNYPPLLTFGFAVNCGMRKQRKRKNMHAVVPTYLVTISEYNTCAYFAEINNPKFEDTCLIPKAKQSRIRPSYSIFISLRNQANC